MEIVYVLFKFSRNWLPWHCLGYVLLFTLCSFSVTDHLTTITRKTSLAFLFLVDDYVFNKITWSVSLLPFDFPSRQVFVWISLDCFYRKSPIYRRAILDCKLLQNLGNAHMLVCLKWTQFNNFHLCLTIPHLLIFLNPFF